MENLYLGSELEIFQHANNWKSYYGSLITPHLGTKVLEVGAGMGATTQALCRAHHDWTCLEPDTRLANEIKGKVAAAVLPSSCVAIIGSLADVSETERFDSILYIDVLEHIAHDDDEIELAVRHLQSSGHLIVMAPAHQALFSPFDSAVGHFRRYDKAALTALVPSELKLIKLLYLDSAGALASAANRLALRQSAPTHRQIQFWDSRLVPISRMLDSLTGYRVGKSVLGIWQKRARP